jgi:ClpX C4-type zinc finger
VVLNTSTLAHRCRRRGVHPIINQSGWRTSAWARIPDSSRTSREGRKVSQAVIHRTLRTHCCGVPSANSHCQNQTGPLANLASELQIALARQGRSATMIATACGFCGRNVDQATHLIQGPELFICDICVDACVDTLATKDHGWRERQIDYLLRLRNRRTLAAGS